MQAAAMELFTGCITAKSATDIYYLTHRCVHSDKESRSKLNQLLTIIGMLDSMADDIFHAISSDVKENDYTFYCPCLFRFTALIASPAEGVREGSVPLSLMGAWPRTRI